MKRIKTYDDIKSFDKDMFIERTEKLTAEEARKIINATEMYGRETLYRNENQTLRDNIIRMAIYGNTSNTKYILKAIELSLIFYDRGWYDMTRDFNTARRAVEFNTSEENVVMYDALFEKTEQVLAYKKVKSL